MNRDGRKGRIPTSDELEQQGTLASPAEDTPDKRGGLLRFFRGTRLRVSDDVAARKHVGGSETQPPVAPQARPTTQRATAPEPPESEAPVRPVDSIQPRQIRIAPSVKERRGLGTDNGAKGLGT